MIFFFLGLINQTTAQIEEMNNKICVQNEVGEEPVVLLEQRVKEMNYLQTLDANLVDDMIGVEVVSIRNRNKIMKDLCTEICILRGYGQQVCGALIEKDTGCVVGSAFCYDEEDKKMYRDYYDGHYSSKDDIEDFKSDGKYSIIGLDKYAYERC